MKRILSFGVLVLVVGLALATGAVAAQEASTSIIDEEVTIDNDTQAVWYEVVAVDDLNGSTLNASVTYEGLEEGQEAGNGTELSTDSFEITEDGGAATGEYALADGDETTYDRIRVHVNATTEADVDIVASSDYGQTAKISGGGGGFLGGAGGSSAIIAIVAILGIGLYVRD